MDYNAIELLLQARLHRGKRKEPSGRWLIWKAILDRKICILCKELNGTIRAASGYQTPEPPLHPNCRCEMVLLDAIQAGTATIRGLHGADVFFLQYKVLPGYYIDKWSARQLGWRQRKGNLWEVLPDRVIGGNMYLNDDYKLPAEIGRIWYEADINYVGGYRGDARLMFSSDGLLFVTYDHYETFMEVY